MTMARFLNNRILESYFQLRDWTGYLMWLEAYKEAPFVGADKLVGGLSDSDSLKQQIESQIDINYIKYLRDNKTSFN